MRNTLVRILSSMWFTAMMLVLLSVAAMLDPFGPWYWAVLVAYVVQCVYGFTLRRRAGPFVPVPSWRRTDSRTTDGDERG